MFIFLAYFARICPDLYMSVEVKADALFDWCGSNGLSTLRPESSENDEGPIYAYQYREPTKTNISWGNWHLKFWMQAGSFPFPVGRTLEISQDRAISLEFKNGLELPAFEAKKRSLSALLSSLSGNHIDLYIFAVTPKPEQLNC